MIFVLRCPSLLSSSVLLALCWPFNSSSQESDPAVKEVCRNSIDLRYTVITHDVRIAAETAGTNLETSCGTEEPMPWCWKVDHQSITAEFDDVTPVRIDKPEFRISMSKYDKSESRIKSWRQLAAKSIESGIQHGFRGLLRISQTACVGCSAHFWCITNPNFNHCYDCKFAPVFQSRNWISGVKEWCQTLREQFGSVGFQCQPLGQSCKTTCIRKHHGTRTSVQNQSFRMHVALQVGLLQNPGHES